MRDRHAVRRARADGRQRRHVSVRDEDGRPQDGHDGDVHAEADLRRNRERHARPPAPGAEGQKQNDRPKGRLRGSRRDLPLLQRRAHGPRPQPVRVHEPDDELVPPARAGLRGARVHRLVEAQPEREHPHPDVLPGDRGGQADRIPYARPGLQPIPLVRGDAVRRPGRRQAEDRPRQPGRRGSVPSQREQAQGVRRPRAPRLLEGINRAPADGLHVPEDRLPAGPARKVRGAEARRAPANLATALAVRVLPVHGRLSQAGIGSLTPSQTTAVVRWPTGGVEIRHARVRSVRIQPSNTAPGAGLARRASMASIQVFLDNWFVRHLGALKTTMRVIFGVVWTVDGAFKFQPGFADSLAQMISDAGQGQPSWLQPWFGFWSQTVSANPGFFVTTIGVLELALGFGLLLGFMRKVAYAAGFFLSLVIWSVPEGFGGPYGPSSTDIGTGIIYAFVFLLLMIINAAFGPSRWSLDYAIERRWPAWKKASEIRSAA